MAKRMNGTETHSKTQNLIYDGKTIDNDLDKTNFLPTLFRKLAVTKIIPVHLGLISGK